MALVRWNPWRDMATLQQQMNRLFDEALVPATGWERSLVRVPAAEMEETKDAIHLKLEVPGIEAKDLDISVSQSSGPSYFSISLFHRTDLILSRTSGDKSANFIRFSPKD